MKFKIVKVKRHIINIFKNICYYSQVVEKSNCSNKLRTKSRIDEFRGIRIIICIELEV